MARTDLGKWMITDGGRYDPETVYEQLTGVLYNGSTYLTLKTVMGVEPSDDGINYRLMAKGFADEDFSALYYLYAGMKDKEDEVDEDGNVIYEGTPQIDADSLGGNLPEYYAPQNEITDAFSESKSYAVGDYCIFLNGLYRFIIAKPSGPWDGTKVVPVTVATELQRLTSDVSQLNSRLRELKVVSNTNLKQYLSNMSYNTFDVFSFYNITDNPFGSINSGFLIAFRSYPISKDIFILGISDKNTECIRLIM